MARAAKKQTAKKVDDAGYPLYPSDLTKTAWLYQQSDGLLVVQEAKDGRNRHLATVQVTVPWAAVEAAVDQHRKIKKV